MKILAVGDVVGDSGSNFLRQHLSNLKKERNIDFIIANGENSDHGNGITRRSTSFLFESGVDVITTGNHAFRRYEALKLFDEEKYLIRPANYPNGTTPGNGMCIMDNGKHKICVINVMGLTYLDSLGCPFRTMDKLLRSVTETNIIIVDFHAEATAEKRCLGFYLDGRVSAVFGTHTHVPTADEDILPKGTGYITDLGMTGVIHSSLGVKPEIAIRRMKNKLPVKFEFAEGKCKMDCVLFDIDETTGKAISIERISIK